MALRGREAECARLCALLDPTPGDRLVLFLDGAIGSGKTAVLDAVTADIGCRVVRTGPISTGSDEPLQALERAFRALAVRPEPGSDPVTVADELARALATEPTVLAVDDVHWMDAASLDVLIQLIVHAKDLTLLVAHRPTQVPHALLEAARRSGIRLDRVRLPALDDLTLAHIAGDVPADAASRIIDRSDGNPLFARLLSQLWWERPSTEAFDAALDGLRLDEMPSVYGALRSDLRSLDPQTQSVLRAVAIVGRLHVEAVVALTDLDAGTVARSAEVLRGRELIAPGRDGLHASHPLIRASAYRGVDAADRLRAHRLLSGMSDSFSELERAEHLHLLAGSQTPDDVEAIKQAASVALADEPAAAVRWLSSTLHRRDPARDILLARAMIVCGRADDAAEILDDLSRAEQTGESRALQIQALRMAGELRQAHDLLEAAVGLDDLAFQVERAALAISRDRWDEALDTLELFARAHPEDGPTSAPLLAVGALRTLGHLNAGDIASARVVFDAVHAGLEAASPAQWREVVDMCANVGWAAYVLERYDVAVSIVDRALSVARESGRVHARAQLQTVRAFAMVAGGRLDEAADSADAALADARTYSGPDAVSIATAARLFVAEWRDDQTRIAEVADDLRAAGLPEDAWWRRTVRTLALRVDARLDPPRTAPMVDLAPDALLTYRLLDAATIHLSLGAGDEAARLVARAREAGTGHGLVVQEAHITMAEARIAADVDGDPQRAADLAQDAKVVFEGLGMPLHYVRASLRERQYRARVENALVSRLTPREREIAHLVARGLANKEIATELSISPRTVEEHVGRIVSKLGVASRAAVGLALAG